MLSERLAGRPRSRGRAAAHRPPARCPETAFSTGTTAWLARAVDDRVEGLLERGAGHQPRIGAQQRLRRFFAVGAGRALIGGVGDRCVDIELLHRALSRFSWRPNQGIYCLMTGLKSRANVAHRHSPNHMKRGLGLVRRPAVRWRCSCRVAGIAVLYFMVGPRAPRVADSSTLVLRPGGEIFEIVPDDVLQFVSRAEARTVRGYVEALRKAKVDKRVAGVLLAPARAELAVLGQGAGTARGGRRLQDLGQAGVRLSRIRRRPRVLPRDRGRQGLSRCRPRRWTSPASRPTRSFCAARSTGSAPIPICSTSAITRPPSTSSPRRRSRPRTRR